MVVSGPCDACWRGWFQAGAGACAGLPAEAVSGMCAGLLRSPAWLRRTGCAPLLEGRLTEQDRGARVADPAWVKEGSLPWLCGVDALFFVGSPGDLPAAVGLRVR